MSVLNRISHDELQKVLSQLNQGLYNHQQWHNSLIRTLVCRLPGDKHDLLPDGDKECRFGQWYFSEAAKSLAEHPGFQAIGAAHKSMHEQALHLLTDASNTVSIEPNEYDHFANSLEQLRLEVFSLKNEVESLIFNRDALTNTINRINMPQTLREQQELIKRQQQNCCLMLIDLDEFKKVNDTYGHLAGDMVLSTTAHYMLENIRPYDKIFRYGGEEFLITLPFTDIIEGQEIAERLRKGIEAMNIEVKPNINVHITISIGLTLLDPNTAVELSIDNADKAMFEAKASGRNCAKVWKHN